MIHNLGSIHIDETFYFAHMPLSGETVVANHFHTCLGGKGANQSLALARAGVRVRHLGATNSSSWPWLQDLQQAGVNLDDLRTIPEPTGKAIILVDHVGGNRIICLTGANACIQETDLDEWLAKTKPGDWVLTQNETNLSHEWLKKAHAKGLRLIYNPAPYLELGLPELPLDVLVLNHIELGKMLHVNLLEGKSRQLAFNWSISHPETCLVMTSGAQGAYAWKNGLEHYQPAPAVHSIDSSGAGDTFIGYFLAKLIDSNDIQESLAYGVMAASHSITRLGTSLSIPTIDEIGCF